MAYIEQDLEEEGKEEGMTAPSAPSTIETGAATSPKPAAQASGTESGMFANIQKYVEKNRPQAQEMARQLSGGFGKKAEGVESAAKGKTEAFEKGAIAQEKAKLQSTADLAQQAVQKAGQEGYRAEDIASGEQFQSLRGLKDLPGQYQQFQTPDFAQDILKAEQLQKQAGRAATGSKADLLRSQYGDKSGYTRGQSVLDEMILQAPKAQQTLQKSLAGAARGLSGRIRAEQARARGLVAGDTGLTGQAQQIQQQLVGGAETQEQALQDVLTGKAETETERRQRIQQAVAEAYDPTRVINIPGFGDVNLEQAKQMSALGEAQYIARNPFQISQDIATKYGVTPEEVYSSLGLQGPSAVWGGVDPETMLQLSQATGQQYASEADLARARALASLAGRAPSEAIVSGVGTETPVYSNLGEWQSSRQAEYNRLRDIWGEQLLNDMLASQGTLK